MNQSQTVPEYSVEESEKTHLTVKQLVCISQMLLDQEVDSRVLQKELESLVDLSGRISVSLRKVRSLLQEDI